MARPPLEVADIFRHNGQAWRLAHAGHISLGQLQVMSAIEQCRTKVLGGHVLHCVQCDDQQIAYNSCRNRHCPKCCGSKAQQWLEAREAELLPVEYYHVVFTLPAAIADLAYQNKTVLYDLLFKASAETLTTIAADPKHLGAKIGLPAAKPVDDLPVNPLVIQQIEVIFLRKKPAVLWLDVQSAQRMAVASHCTVHAYQQITQQLCQWIMPVPSHGGCGEVVIDTR